MGGQVVVDLVEVSSLILNSEGDPNLPVWDTVGESRLLHTPSLGLEGMP